MKSLEGKVLDYEAERNAINAVYSGEIFDEYKKQIEALIGRLNYFTLEKKTEAQRVFRQMSGIYFAVPQLMVWYGKKYCDKTAQVFGEILLVSSNWSRSWAEIQDLISKELAGQRPNKWELRKLLQEFSVSVPVWTVLKSARLLNAVKGRGFKGFPVLKDLEEKQLEILWEQGIDATFGVDMDVEDIL
jgi:CRISPR-associated endonuclease/helicase Cas3